MRKLIFIIPAVITTFIVCGCAISPNHNVTIPKRSAAIPVLVESKQLPQEYIPAANTAFPASDAPKVFPDGQRSIVEPQPIRNPEEIVEETLVAYTDEYGRVYDTTTRKVVTKQATWNLNAVRSRNGYIPVANQKKVEVLPGYATYGESAVVPPASVKLIDLSDPRVIATGRINPNDELEARAMAPEGYTAIYDSKAGWVIIPQAMLDDIMLVDSPMIPEAKTTNKTEDKQIEDAGDLK